MSWAEVEKRYSMPSDHSLEDYTPVDSDFPYREDESKHYNNTYKLCKNCGKKFTKGEGHMVMWYEGLLNLDWTCTFKPPRTCAAYCMENVLE